jgi:hypothetical protein
VAVTVVAKHLKLSGWSFARHLRQAGTPLLAVPIPDEGKGMRCFSAKVLQPGSGQVRTYSVPLA